MPVDLAEIRVSEGLANALKPAHEILPRGLPSRWISVILLFDGLAIRLFDGFELLECCVTRYVGGATELCNPVMWDMRDTARRWSKFAET